MFMAFIDSDKIKMSQNLDKTKNKTHADASQADVIILTV